MTASYNKHWRIYAVCKIDSKTVEFLYVHFWHFKTTKHDLIITTRVMWTPCLQAPKIGSLLFGMVSHLTKNRVFRFMIKQSGGVEISGDDGGSIKYWKSNKNNVLVNISAHHEPVRDLSFCRRNHIYNSRYWNCDLNKPGRLSLVT